MPPPMTATTGRAGGPDGPRPALMRHPPGRREPRRRRRAGGRARARAHDGSAGTAATADQSKDCPMASSSRRVAASHRTPARPARYAVLGGSAQPGRHLVLGGQVGAEHGRVVGRDRARHARGAQRGQRVGGQGRDGAGGHVGGRADVQHHAPPGQVAQQRRVLGGADAVPDPGRAQQVQGGPDQVRPLDLAGVRDGGQAAVPGQREHLGVQLGRNSPSRPGPARRRPAGVGHGLPGGLRHQLGREPAADVGGQPDVHAVPLAGLLGAVAVAGEHLGPARAPADRLGRGRRCPRCRPRRARPPRPRSPPPPAGSRPRCAARRWSATRSR